MKKLLFFLAFPLLVNAQNYSVDPTLALRVVGGNTITISQSFTNATGTNSYASADMVCNAATNLLTFPVAKYNGGSGYITKVALTTNGTNTTAGFRVWFYRSVPSTLPGDNNPFTLAWANRTSRIGFIDTGSLAQEGAGSECVYGQNITDRLPFAANYNTNVIYAAIEAKGAFTGITNQVFNLEITSEQN